MLYGSINFSIIFFITLFHLPTAEAIDRKADELSSFMDLSKLLTQVFDVKELGETLTKTANRVCRANSSWLVIKNDGELKVEVANNIGLIEADELSSKILNYNFNLDEVMIFDEKSLKENITKLGIQSIAATPLKVHNSINGYLFAARKNEISFDDDEKRIMSALSHYGAIAIENAKLFEESIIKERMEKELDVAREIQKKLLPEKNPNLSGLDITSAFIPAFEVGGDYYDFFKVAEDKLGFVIADVSGKGIPAAFIMAEVKGVFESLSNFIESPKEVLARANHSLKDSLDNKTFVTALFGVINLKNGKVKFARAGHMPLILKRNNQIEEFAPKGIGLGIGGDKIFNDSLEEIEIELHDNDVVVLSTDGIPEAQNMELENFGFDNFKSIIAENKNNNIKVLSNEILRKVSVFSTSKSQHDDITLVIFKWNNNNNSGEMNG